ncbi:MAG TPA: LysO family transporter [Thermoplasmata archaeon]|nr:LysO family transporter [Thermoplasmata archaeon]
MSIDLFLYVAFAIGLVAGRLVRVPGPWIPRATLVTIVVLVGLLGASLAGIPAQTLLTAIPLGLLFALLILGATTVAVLLLRRAVPPREAPRPGLARRERLPLSLVLLASLLVGYALGRLVSFPAVALIPYALYALLALVAFGLRLELRILRRVWIPLVAAVAGALVAAGAYAAVTGMAPLLALSSSLAFGWYTLAGPLVAARAGAAIGLVAFLANFLRENFTMLSSPVLGKSVGGEGLTALGGATSMDTTLYFVTRYGDADAGSLAIANGFVLTVAAGLLLPALLAFAP